MMRVILTELTLRCLGGKVEPPTKILYINLSPEQYQT